MPCTAYVLVVVVVEIVSSGSVVVVSGVVVVVSGVVVVSIFGTV